MHRLIAMLVLISACQGRQPTRREGEARGASNVPSDPPAPRAAPAPFGRIVGIAWSPDGRTIAAIDMALSARAWDAATLERRGAMTPGALHGKAPVAIAFDTSGSEVLAGATRWHIEGNRRTPLFIGGRARGSGGAAELSIDWRVSVEAVGDDVVVANAESGQELHRLRGFAGVEIAVSTAAGPFVVWGGRKLAIGDARGNARGHITAPARERWERFGCSVSPRGDFAAAATDAGRFVLIDTVAPAIAGELGAPTPEDANRFTRFSADGSRLLVLQDHVRREGSSLHVDIYEIPSRRLISSFDLGQVAPAHLSVTPDASRIAAAGFERRVAVYDAANGTRIASIDPGVQGQRAAAFDPAGTRVVIGAGRTVAIFEIETGERVATSTTK